MDNSCSIPYLVQAFYYVKNSGQNLVFKLAKPLTSMTAASKSGILTTMCEQTKQT